MEQKLGGAIAIRYSSEEKLGDLLWTHSTNTMIVGYMNSTEQTAMVKKSLFKIQLKYQKLIICGRLKRKVPNVRKINF